MIDKHAQTVVSKSRNHPCGCPHQQRPAFVAGLAAILFAIGLALIRVPATPLHSSDRTPSLALGTKIMDFRQGLILGVWTTRSQATRISVGLRASQASAPSPSWNPLPLRLIQKIAIQPTPEVPHNTAAERRSHETFAFRNAIPCPGHGRPLG